MRARYARHLAAITDHAPQLTICLSYDQDVMPGPPFSVPADVIDALYSDSYELTELASGPLPNLLKGVCPAVSTVWLLRVRAS